MIALVLVAVLGQSVSGVYPLSGVPGTPVTVVGAGFGASGGLVSFQVDGGGPLVSWPVSNWSDGEIQAVVGPGVVGSGQVFVTTASGGVSGGVSFQATDYVVWLLMGILFVLSAMYGHKTWEVMRFALRSKRFLSVAFVWVCLGGVERLSFGQYASNPFISSISPSNPVPGSALIITGSGFGTQNGGVNFSSSGGGGPSLISAWSDGSVTVTVPSSCTVGSSGGLTLYTFNNAGQSVFNGFTYGSGSGGGGTGGGGSGGGGTGGQVGPVVNAVSPSSGVAGTVVSIGGQGFGGAIGSVTFTAGGGSPVQATVNSWSDSSIQVVVPSNSGWSVGVALTIGVVNAIGQDASWVSTFDWGVASSGGGALGLQGDPLASGYAGLSGQKQSTCGPCFGIMGRSGGYYGTSGNTQEVTTYFAEFPCPLMTQSGGGTGPCQVAMYPNEGMFSSSVSVSSVTFVWNPVFGGMSTALGDYIWANPACNGMWQVVWQSGAVADIGPLAEPPGTCLAQYYGSSGGPGSGLYTVNPIADCPPQGGGGSSQDISWGNFTNPLSGALPFNLYDQAGMQAALPQPSWLWTSLGQSYAAAPLYLDLPGQGSIPFYLTSQLTTNGSGSAGTAADTFRTTLRAFWQLWWTWGFFVRVWQAVKLW